ncbi:zinc-ribbon domain-containing protein [Derxia lacustris]|uniref:zinc-ribbon domain-containing protein n=1 Tax=Derxia lacustris TaxID=764842 RepID=UPI000A17228F|nr:zinc-ribbon domain-containing protein [Derxia lacustris]
MSYDYSSESRRLELPNPYRVQNLFLFLGAAALIGGGVLALLLARDVLQGGALGSAGPRALAPLVVGLALLASGLAAAAIAARRLRFFFGRGRPASLAPEIGAGVTGSSKKADALREMLRQGGIEYPEPRGAFNGVLYHLLPRLITAPLGVQNQMQKQFFNAIALLATLASFGTSWFLFGTAQSRPWVAAGYCAFGAWFVLRPLVTEDRARMSTATFVALIALAILAPVLVALAGPTLPPLPLSLHVQTFALLGTALVAVLLILAALLAQTGAQPSTERSREQATLALNAPPGALLDELDRHFQSRWTEGIPNRRYIRLEPQIDLARGAGQFAAELFEETQPMPVASTTAPGFHGAFSHPRHRWLAALDAYALLLTLAAVLLALGWVRAQADGEGASGFFALAPGHVPVGLALIFGLVAAFCTRASAAVWGRFDFESTLTWVEMIGSWTASSIGTGNAWNSRLNTQNQVVRTEAMTLRVWRARIESVTFAKDDARQVVAMFSTQKEARALVDHLAGFGQAQSVFVAPGAAADAERLAVLQAGERAMIDPSALAATALSEASAASLHAQLRAATANAAVVEAAPACAHCAAPLPAGARFCPACGATVAPAAS